MSLTDYVLSALGIYGLPILFVALLVGSIGIPLPNSLLLLVAGSFVAQDHLKLWPVLGLAVAGAILGDSVGYVLGRWGGRRINRRLVRIGGQDRLDRDKAWVVRWEGAGIFFSRFLPPPLGSFVNIISGLNRYSLPRFVVYCVAGQALKIVIHVMLGKTFNDRVLMVSEFLGDLTWAIVGLVLLLMLGWKLFRHFGSPSTPMATAD